MQSIAVLGINSAYHESSACLLVDGRLAAFVEEERLNRVKHAKPALVTNPDELPVNAIRYCLEQGAVKPEDVALVGFSLDPHERRHRME